MRIVHISMSPFSSSYGGLEIYLQQIVQWQISQGHDVTVLSIFYQGKNWEECIVQKNDHLTILELHLPQQFQVKHYDNIQPELLSRLKELLLRIRPDICHGHHGFAHEAVPLCRELKIPVIYTAHCPEPFCATGMCYRPNNQCCDGKGNFLKCLYCQTPNLRFGAICRMIAFLLPASIRTWLEHKIDDWPFVLFVTPLFYETRILRHLALEIQHLSECNLIIAPSQAIAKLAKQNGMVAPVKVLPHALPDYIQLQPFPVFQGGIVHFYYIGRICNYKGLHILLKAFSLLQNQNWRLHLIGEAARCGEQEYQKGLQHNYPDDRILWHGRILHQKLTEMLKDFHCLIHPALCLESFGLTVAEAIAMGHPVISTACGGPEEQIISGKNGWIIPKNDVTALCNRIDSILANPEQLLNYHRNCIRSSWSEYMQNLMELYSGIRNS